MNYLDSRRGPSTPLNEVSLRLLVIGINYAPEHAGIAPYTTQVCEHMAAQGHKVYVLSGIPSYPSWEVSREYKWRLAVEEERDGLQVRRLRHYVPARQTAIRRGLYEMTYGVHVLLDRLPWRPDVIFAVTPSLLGACAGAIMASRMNVPLGIWVQDLMGLAAKESGVSGGGRVADLTYRVERWVLRRGQRVIVINEAFRCQLITSGIPAGRVTLVPNWAHVRNPKRERSKMRAELGWPDDEFIVLHTGNMGNKQGLENAVRAARLADIHALRVRFVLLGDGSQRSRLEQAGQGVERLQFLDPVCDEIYAEVLSAADALLINERETVFNMSLPSKLTSYFAAGRPVIAAVSRDGTTARELLRAQAGMVAEPNNPKELLETALALMLDPDTNSKYAVNARLYARRNLEKSASLRRVEELILDLADASNQLGARATGL